jgi:hypothetical protein
MMCVSKYYQARVAAGLCVICNVMRGDGGTKTRCAACAAKMRLYNRTHPQKSPPNLAPQTRENIRLYHTQRYAERVTTGVCTLCGGKRTKAEVAKGRVCDTCCRHRKEISACARQKKRDQAAGTPEGNPYHWPNGVLPKLPKGGGESLRLHLDDRSYAALLNLWKLYRKAEIDAGRQPHTRRASQLVREAIHQWRDRLIGPSPYPRTLMARTITIYLDSETLGILQWQARSCFKNNKSAALRTIMTAVGYPKPIPVAIPKSRDKWLSDDWQNHLSFHIVIPLPFERLILLKKSMH